MSPSSEAVLKAIKTKITKPDQRVKPRDLLGLTGLECSEKTIWRAMNFLAQEGYLCRGGYKSKQGYWLPLAQAS